MMLADGRWSWAQKVHGHEGRLHPQEAPGNHRRVTSLWATSTSGGAMRELGSRDGGGSASEGGLSIQRTAGVEAVLSLLSQNRIGGHWLGSAPRISTSHQEPHPAPRGILVGATL